MDRIIDRVDAFALRYRKLLMILGGLWLMLSWASSALFIKVPEIPFLTGTMGIMASSACAALWWALINPRIQKRRAARDLAGTKDADQTMVEVVR